jgi:hypothetical protein
MPESSNRNIARAIIDVLRSATVADASASSLEVDSHDGGEQQSELEPDTHSADDDAEAADTPGATADEPLGPWANYAAAAKALECGARRVDTAPAAAVEKAHDVGPAQAPVHRKHGLASGETEEFSNGATVTLDAERGKFLVMDSAGVLHGMRRTYEIAVEFARSLPVAGLPHHAPPTLDAIPREERPFPSHRQPRVLRKPPR